MTDKQDDAFSATLEAWRKWSEDVRRFWTDAACASLGQDQSETASPSPPLNPFQMWGPFITPWIDFWSKAGTQLGSQTPARTLEKLWTDQIESGANAYRRVANTESFADAMGQYFSRVLTWGQRLNNALVPQVEATLREANVPSRKQVDRLFERIIGLEERLDDMEARDREILRALKNLAAEVEAADDYPREESAPRRRRGVRAAKKKA